MAPTSPGSRPASARARRRRNSIWALVLRSSSAAQRVRASWTAGSSRSRMLLRSLTGLLGLLVEGAGVDHLLGGLLAAQHDQQVGHHGGFAFFVELDDVLFFEPAQRELDHADRALNDFHPGADDGAGLLLAQHGLGDLGGIRQPGQP